MLTLASHSQQHPFMDTANITVYCVSLSPAELPSPALASMSELRSSCMKILRKMRPTELGYSYEEIKAMDEVSVNLLPEKKGMVFKHVEYLVESKVSQTVQQGMVSRWIIYGGQDNVGGKRGGHAGERRGR